MRGSSPGGGDPRDSLIVAAVLLLELLMFGGCILLVRWLTH